jgi:hypothetical protein
VPNVAIRHCIAATDKHLIYEGLSRAAADAVLAGAATVRAGDIVFSVWHPEDST